jgi:hypothetical protein
MVTQALIILVVGQIASGLLLLGVLIAIVRERSLQRRELLHITQKIEFLTAPVRERVVGHYDGVLADLIERVPTVIAREAGGKIFETESRIISRLAELEPNLKGDPRTREKMNGLIESMESLEATVSAAAADTVRTTLNEARRGLVAELLRLHR